MGTAILETPEACVRTSHMTLVSCGHLCPSPTSPVLISIMGFKNLFQFEHKMVSHCFSVYCFKRGLHLLGREVVLVRGSCMGKHTPSGWLERGRNTHGENDTPPLPWLGRNFTRLIRSREERGRAQDLRAQFGTLHGPSAWPW